jgi:hypothetical protein
MLPIITPDKIALSPGTLADYEQILAQLSDRTIFCIR